MEKMKDGTWRCSCGCKYWDKTDNGWQCHSCQEDFRRRPKPSLPHGATRRYRFVQLGEQ